jgi:lysophospholipase L1-like esterase
MKTTRRDFIKNTGLAGIAAMSLPGLASLPDTLKISKTDNKEKQLTILFQGDSVTDGNRTRNNDWSHCLGHGYVYLIASRLWYNHTDRNLMFYNRGVGGDIVKDLENRWQQDTLDLKPDLISILVGVNDIHLIVKNRNPETAEQFEERYKKILDKTKEALPDTRIVLCEPFILPIGMVTEKTDVWEKALKERQDIIGKLSGIYKTSLVKLQDAFNEACKRAPADYWSSDGVHPKPAGHELIARTWLKTVRQELTFIKE